MLQGKSALVTGSTSGIGLGVARALASAGASVMLSGLGDARRVEELRASLASEFSVDVLYDDVDLMDPSGPAHLVARTQSEFGSCDVLVNNAGIQHVAPIDGFPVERWNDVIALNLTAVFLGMRAAIPGMRSRSWGRIINISSAHGLVASVHKVAYVAAKHGVIGATKVAALEVAHDAITVNAICPGWVSTPLVQSQLRDRAEAHGSDIETETLNLLSEKQPMLAFTTPESIGAMTLFLCSEAAATVTGAALSIDGGWTAQ